MSVQTRQSQFIFRDRHSLALSGFYALSGCLIAGFSGLPATADAAKNATATYVPPSNFERPKDFALSGMTATSGTQTAMALPSSSLDQSSLTTRSAHTQKKGAANKNVNNFVDLAHIKALALVKAGKLDEAGQTVSRTLAMAPGNVTLTRDLINIDLGKAKYFAKQQRLDQALSSARQAVYLNSSNNQATDLLDSILSQAGLDPRDAKVRLKQADQLALAGSNNEAFVEYQAAIAFGLPAQAHVSLGNMNAKANKPILAKAEYEKALESDSNSEIAHRQLGILYANQADAVGANAELTRAVVLDGNDTAAATALTDLWQRQVGKSPGDVNAYFGLARAYQLTGDLKNAQIQYRQIVLLDPKNPHLPEARLSFKLALARQESTRAMQAAKTLEAQGAMQDAAAKAVEAAEIDPGNINVLSYAGYMMEKVGRLDLARQRYLSVMKADPNNNYAAQRLKALSQPAYPSAQVVAQSRAQYQQAAQAQANLALQQQQMQPQMDQPGTISNLLWKVRGAAVKDRTAMNKREDNIEGMQKLAMQLGITGDPDDMAGSGAPAAAGAGLPPGVANVMGGGASGAGLPPGIAALVGAPAGTAAGGTAPPSTAGLPANIANLINNGKAAVDGGSSATAPAGGGAAGAGGGIAGLMSSLGPEGIQAIMGAIGADGVQKAIAALNSGGVPALMTALGPDGIQKVMGAIGPDGVKKLLAAVGGGGATAAPAQATVPVAIAPPAGASGGMQALMSSLGPEGIQQIMGALGPEGVQKAIAALNSGGVPALMSALGPEGISKVMAAIGPDGVKKLLAAVNGGGGTTGAAVPAGARSAGSAAGSFGAPPGLPDLGSAQAPAGKAKTATKLSGKASKTAIKGKAGNKAIAAKKPTAKTKAGAPKAIATAPTAAPPATATAAAAPTTPASPFAGLSQFMPVINMAMQRFISLENQTNTIQGQLQQTQKAVREMQSVMRGGVPVSATNVAIDTPTGATTAPANATQFAAPAGLPPLGSASDAATDNASPSSQFSAPAGLPPLGSAVEASSSVQSSNPPQFSTPAGLPPLGSATESAGSPQFSTPAGLPPLGSASSNAANQSPSITPTDLPQLRGPATNAPANESPTNLPRLGPAADAADSATPVAMRPATQVDLGTTATSAPGITTSAPDASAGISAGLPAGISAGNSNGISSVNSASPAANSLTQTPASASVVPGESGSKSAALAMVPPAAGDAAANAASTPNIKFTDPGDVSAATKNGDSDDAPAPTGKPKKPNKIRMEVEGVRPDILGIRIKIVIKNDGNHSIPLPSNPMSIIKRCKISLPDNTNSVPAHGEVHGSIKVPIP